jgi:hypothetical protein
MIDGIVACTGLLLCVLVGGIWGFIQCRRFLKG